jgi:hypothetical protein
VFPPAFDRIEIEQVPVILAHGYEHIVRLADSKLAEPRIGKDELAGNIVKHQPSLPSFAQTKTTPRLETDQIHVLGIAKNILRFIEPALKRPFREVPGAEHADARASLAGCAIVCDGLQIGAVVMMR